VIEDGGVSLTLIAGSLFGKTSAVTTFSEMFYADVTLEADASFQIGAEFEERAIYIVSGSIGFSSELVKYGAGPLLILKPSEEIIVSAVSGPARIMLLGGEPVGPRHIWWNFVSSSTERIEQAKLDWKERRIGEIPGETERIPLPADSRPRVVNYP
jgi:redox-sensitive bicupin YhaK (pirin superfamily)